MSLIGNYVKNVKMDFDALEFDETSALESTHEKYRSRFLSILDKKRVLQGHRRRCFVSDGTVRCFIW
jgi:hypothetical protein